MGKQMRKPRKKVTLPPFVGDHGTGTAAATAGTVLEPITDAEGRNPNRQARRRRVNAIDEITSLSMRQAQAAKAIEIAYCRVEQLSSGGEIKERVQSSPKPDQTVAIQCDANSRLVQVMAAVPSAMRAVVEHVCWHNRPLSAMRPVNMRASHTAGLKVALDLVANRLRY